MSSTCVRLRRRRSNIAKVDPGRIWRATSSCDWRLTKLVVILGEAAKHVGEDARDRYPRGPWAEAARMRDRPVHHYFDINLDVLWSTVTEELPALLRGLEE